MMRSRYAGGSVTHHRVAGAACRVLAGGLAVAVLALTAGCGSAGGSPEHGGPEHGGPAGSGAGYWTRDRLLAARPMRDWALPGGSGATPTAHPPTLAGLRVGALFAHSAAGNHFCTASVVASPGHDLLITAAHCINDGKGGGGYNQDIVFIPDYENGAAPFGVWTPSALFVDPRWATASDPDFDVGFIVLKPDDGKNIQDVLGANRLGFNHGYTSLVRVTGYPSSSDTPVTCQNWTSEQSASQLRFVCGGFYGGTSGSPWVTGFDPRTRTGTIVGVVGGYQAGGDTDSVSYSPYLNDDIRQLYEKAEALG